MKEKIVYFLRDTKGLTTVEYALAGALISAALVATFQALGGTVAGVISNIAVFINP